MDRALTDGERAVVEWMLEGDFEGAAAYRAQVADLRVLGVCGCGGPVLTSWPPALG